MSLVKFRQDSADLLSPQLAAEVIGEIMSIKENNLHTKVASHIQGQNPKIQDEILVTKDKRQELTCITLWNSDGILEN